VNVLLKTSRILATGELLSALQNTLICVIFVVAVHCQKRFYVENVGDHLMRSGCGVASKWLGTKNDHFYLVLDVCMIEG